MTAEGWEGKSVRYHVEVADGVAHDAYELALGNEEKLDNLIAEVGLVLRNTVNILAALDRSAKQSRRDPDSVDPEQAVATSKAERRHD
ncbi:hypothetical protein [Phaeovulum sp.]|uniref:hypothetical protein n=1 Tax=Phaeovulum sp. TaxID=2934796 RepID=UPI0035622439